MEICKRCKYAPTCSAASNSDFCLNYDPRPLTNADGLRASTDEELAEWIYKVQDEDAYRKENFLQKLSKHWWLEWLRQEAETN